MSNKNIGLVMRGLTALPLDPSKFREKDKVIFEMARMIATEYVKGDDLRKSEARRKAAEARLLSTEDSRYDVPFRSYISENGSLLFSPGSGYASNQEVVEKLVRYRNSSADTFRKTFSKHWEVPRARTCRKPMINKRYSEGCLWSPRAARTVLNKNGSIIQQNAREGRLLLEHVVPLEFIRSTFYDCAEVDLELAENFLHTFVTHVIIAGESENTRIRQYMTNEEQDAIRRHAFGREELSADDIFEVRFGRYLEAQSEGIVLERFKTLTEHKAKRVEGRS